MTIKLLVALTTVLFFETIHPQSALAKTDTAPAWHHTSTTRPVTNSIRIKWTRQLPSVVRNSFYKSRYANWYIEKMIRLESNGKTLYRFYLNNGNLLDGDHHDSFLRTTCLDISDKGNILVN